MQTKVKSFTQLLTAVVVLTFFSFSVTAQVISIDIPDTVEDVGVFEKTEPEEPSIPLTTIEFEETSYDFGEIESGEIVSHVFTFTNTGNELLILSNVKGSCGCTVPQWPREPITPGETASITVKFNSKHKKGKRNQRVTLTANTDPTQTFIYLTGKVNPKKETSETELDIAIEEPAAEANPDCFAIYPNPTAEILKLKVEESSLGKSAVISIYSKAGQLMAKRDIPSIEGTIEFSVSHYSAGTYVANVQIGDSKPEVRCFVVME